MIDVEQYTLHIRDTLAPVATKATVPFFVLHDNKVKRCHTGVFLRIGEKHFLVTASHEWKEINSLQLPVFAGWDDDAEQPIQLVNTGFHMSDPATYDVAVANLSQDQAGLLKKRFAPISIRQMRRRDDDEHGIYMMCGCPKEMMLNNGTPAPYLSYICHKFDGERVADPFDTFKFDRQMHVLFTVERDGLDALTFADVQLPSVSGIKGISGCGIWKIGSIKGRSLIRFQPDDVELCAIEHRYNEKTGYVVATWIERVVEGIIHCYPETQKVFEMYPNSAKW